MCRHVHAGAAQVTLTRTQPFAQNLGTFPLVLTGSPTNPNLEIGSLPSSFDPNILLPSPSNVTAQFAYFPTTNFTKPFDLFVQIQIQVCAPHCLGNSAVNCTACCWHVHAGSHLGT